MRKIKELQAKYENFVRLTSPPSASKREIVALGNFFKKFRHKKRVEDFYRMDIEDYKILRKRDNVSAHTVNREVIAVRKFWNWLMDRDPDIRFNPASNTTRLPKDSKPIRPVRPEVLEGVLANCRDDLDRLTILFPLVTGARPTEMARLEWSDFDLETGHVQIFGTWIRYKRTIPLRSDVLELLRARREFVQSEKFVAERTKDSEARTPFGTRQFQTLATRWRRLLHLAGFHGISFLSLRYTFAAGLYQSGLDHSTIQYLLGQRSVLAGMPQTPARLDSARQALENLSTIPPEGQQ